MASFISCCGNCFESKEQINKCHICLSSDKTATTSAAPLQVVPCQYVSWEKLSIDTVGPFETAVWDCHYMLTLTPFLQVYSATPHSTTGPSPFELPCGKKMRTRLDVLPLPLPVARKDARVPSQKVS